MKTSDFSNGRPLEWDTAELNDYERDVSVADMQLAEAKRQEDALNQGMSYQGVASSLHSSLLLAEVRELELFMREERAGRWRDLKLVLFLLSVSAVAGGFALGFFLHS